MAYTHKDDEHWEGGTTNDSVPWFIIAIIAIAVLGLWPFFLAYYLYVKIVGVLTPIDPDYPEMGMSQEEKNWWISTFIGVLVLIAFAVVVTMHIVARNSGGVS